MIISNFTQFNLMLYSIAAGFFTGISFDLYRVIRGFESKNKILGFVEDILFWTLIGILTFAFLFRKSDAIMNYYVYIFIAAGIFLYMVVFSNKLIRYEKRFLAVFLTIMRAICKCFTYPLRLLFNKLFNKE